MVKKKSKNKRVVPLWLSLVAIAFLVIGISVFTLNITGNQVTGKLTAGQMVTVQKTLPSDVDLNADIVTLKTASSSSDWVEFTLDETYAGASVTNRYWYNTVDDRTVGLKHSYNIIRNGVACEQCYIVIPEDCGVPEYCKRSYTVKGASIEVPGKPDAYAPLLEDYFAKYEALN